jgi:hypothetical protein
MHITQESIYEFVDKFMLSDDQINEKTFDSSHHGEFIIMKEDDILNCLDIFFPKVLCNIICGYNEIIVSYTLRYAYSSGFRRIMLSINNDEYKFNHDIYCGCYVGRGSGYGMFLDTDVGILCPRKTKHKINDNYIPSESYNDNIIFNDRLINYFALFLEHIMNRNGILYEFVTNKCNDNKITFIDKDNSVTIKCIGENNITIQIIDEASLIVCINIHIVIYKLLHDLRQTYKSIRNARFRKRYKKLICKHII